MIKESTVRTRLFLFKLRYCASLSHALKIVLHNNAAALQDHYERCWIRTQDICLSHIYLNCDFFFLEKKPHTVTYIRYILIRLLTVQCTVYN